MRNMSCLFIGDIYKHTYTHPGTAGKCIWLEGWVLMSYGPLRDERNESWPWPPGMSDVDTMGKGGRTWSSLNYRTLCIFPKSPTVPESYKTPTLAPPPPERRKISIKTLRTGFWEPLTQRHCSHLVENKGLFSLEPNLSEHGLGTQI